MTSFATESDSDSRFSLSAVHKIIGVLLIIAIPIGSHLRNLQAAAPDPVGQILGANTQDLTTKSNFEEQETTHQEEIPFATTEVKDDTQEIGTRTVTQLGINGVKEVKTTNTYYNGQLYDSKAEPNIIKPPVDEIVTVGTKIVPHTLETDSGTITYTQKLEHFWATSYDSTCLGCTTITYTGMKQGTGVVAVDPKVIPLYTKLYVPGYGLAIAGDIGAAVKGNDIDLGYDSLNGQWSARYVDVYILPDDQPLN